MRKIRFQEDIIVKSPGGWVGVEHGNKTADPFWYFIGLTCRVSRYKLVRAQTVVTIPVRDQLANRN